MLVSGYQHSYSSLPETNGDCCSLIVEKFSTAALFLLSY